MILDLSVVTDTLKKLVDTKWPNAPLWTPATPQFAVDVTGLSPEAVRQGQGAQLSLYLYHIDENNAVESLFWTAQSQAAGGPPVQYQPLALDLYYLLSAYAEGSYIHEQQAMSIAMRIFHENPVIRGVGPDGEPWEATLTPERRSYDELSLAMAGDDERAAAQRGLPRGRRSHRTRAGPSACGQGCLRRPGRRAGYRSPRSAAAEHSPRGPVHRPGRKHGEIRSGSRSGGR